MPSCDDLINGAGAGDVIVGLHWIPWLMSLHMQHILHHQKGNNNSVPCNICICDTCIFASAAHRHWRGSITYAAWICGHTIGAAGTDKPQLGELLHGSSYCPNPQVPLQNVLNQVDTGVAWAISIYLNWNLECSSYPNQQHALMQRYFSQHFWCCAADQSTRLCIKGFASCLEMAVQGSSAFH